MNDRITSNSVPLWIIALTLGAIVLMLFMCAGLCAINAVREEARREELLRREPWRNFVHPSRRYDPSYNGR